jgi:hypothetical protein
MLTHTLLLMLIQLVHFIHQVIIGVAHLYTRQQANVNILIKLSLTPKRNIFDINPSSGILKNKEIFI